MALAAVPASQAIELDHYGSSDIIGIGVRAGVNSSNLSISYGNAMDNTPMLSAHNWRTGVSGGIIIDVNIRSFFAIQTGVYADYRHCEYDAMTEIQDNYITHNSGRISTQYIQVPLLMSLRMRCNAVTQMQFDLGPYFAWQCGGNDKYTSETYNGSERVAPPATYKREVFGDEGYLRGHDVGIKMGVGVLLDKHYYIGAHYLAGCRNMLKNKTYGDGINKEWQFTVGYNF